MSQQLQNDKIPTQDDLRWKELYKIGAISSAIVAILVIFAIIAYLIWPFTAGVISTEEIFIILQNDLLGGLMSLDLILLLTELVNILPLLALYIALKQVNETYALIALVLGLIAVILIIAVRPLADLVYLSDQYAAATSEADRGQYLAAGEALLALFNGTAWMVFTVFLALSGLISALLMRQSHIFKKSTAIAGIVASAPGLAFFIPVLGVLLLFVGTIGGIVWYLLVARDFFQYERQIIAK